MDKVYISKLDIEDVRHLHGITISLSASKMKHLIFTGKNGSGKTSVLESLSQHLNSVATSNAIANSTSNLQIYENRLASLRTNDGNSSEILKCEKNAKVYRERLNAAKAGVSVTFNVPGDILQFSFEKGEFVLAYYKAERVFKAETPKHVEKVTLKDSYAITEYPRQIFVKYLLDLKVTEALFRNGGKNDQADAIKVWFDKFQKLLQRTFDDSSLRLAFDEETFSFSIIEDNHEPFDFNTLSSGFAAVLDIVLDLIVRMEKTSKRSFRFDVPGIVLIDEIETHLHLGLQKRILDLLTTLFPNIQFIITTHSPFVLNSLENVVIYDLEKNLLVENGLTNIPYSGIVEGFFNANQLSDLLKHKFDKYKQLTIKEELTDDDFEEIAELELFLNEIPDYLGLDIATEYQRLKLEFSNREDV